MKKVLIVEAVFYEHISKMLRDGAIANIKKLGYDYEIVSVKGALEIPSVIAIACSESEYIGFVALGCVIRGETSHYDTVCNESARGLINLAIEKKLAIGNGIITVENEEQAIKRADPAMLNKGGFAVEACIDIIKIKEKFIK